MKTVKISIQDTSLDFIRAQESARREALKLISSPMLLSWLDQPGNRFFPNTECCSTKDMPAWELYAKNRGGVIKVDVNDGNYIFIFRSGDIDQN